MSCVVSNILHFAIQMQVNEARKILKSDSPTVSLVIGRKQIDNQIPSPMHLHSSNSEDNFLNTCMLADTPARYSKEPIVVILKKSNLGIGLSLDGGTESNCIKKPIVVKEVYKGNLFVSQHVIIIFIN